MHGGDRVAEVLERHGVRFLFTLCGGHISPILVGAKARGIRVVDVRHEATAVFAADAVARLSGVPGVAAVTAGPGVTNTITAVKNAQLAQSPVVLLGGATATMLKGRGSLQDIDQLALFRPHVKWQSTVSKVREIVPALERAFEAARSGVPGPVFLELPVDLLYDHEVVREWYEQASGRGLKGAFVGLWLRRHVNRLFKNAEASPPVSDPAEPYDPEPPAAAVEKAASRLGRAKRPLLVVGSQALALPEGADALAAAVQRLGIPVYLSGMARGLLGRDHALHFRHKRRQALKEADFVLLAGVPCDFRLDYGRHIRGGTYYVAANRSREELRKNRKPSLAVEGDAGLFVQRLADAAEPPIVPEWQAALRVRDEEREEEIESTSTDPVDEGSNPVALCRAIEAALPDDSVLVADGGDFVGTASYIVRPRGPLRWLDPGVFGTLGVGAGFALGAALCRPESEVWILYGDGSAAYSLAEWDTFVRHGLPVIGVVGNDACWSQIAREQVEVLGDDVGTVLRRTDYHVVAEGYGGRGLVLGVAEQAEEVLAEARALAAAGHPVLVNAHLGRSDFRKGSISI